MKKNKTTFMHAYLSAALMLALSITFTACSPEDEEGKGNAAGAVDLGLSVKWATCNVGAEKPEDLGDYYAWGETEKKTEYTEDTYKHAEDKDGDGDFYDDLNNWEDIGSNISGTPYDVARAKWGGKWRMPTVEEAEELLGKCSWEWTTVNGTNGYTVTGPNGNSIFLPQQDTATTTTHVTATPRATIGWEHKASSAPSWESTSSSTTETPDPPTATAAGECLYAP